MRLASFTEGSFITGRDNNEFGSLMYSEAFNYPTCYRTFTVVANTI